MLETSPDCDQDANDDDGLLAELEKELEEGGLSTGKEMMMGSTRRDLGNTIKEAKNFLKSRELKGVIAEEDDGLGLDSQRFDEGDAMQHQMSACLENAEEEDQLTTNREGDFLGGNLDQEEEDVIDIDDPEQLAAKGLRRI